MFSLEDFLVNLQLNGYQKSNLTHTNRNLYSDIHKWSSSCYAPALEAFWNSAIRPSVCPVGQLPRHVIGTLAACSLATAGYHRCADCGPVRGRT